MNNRFDADDNIARAFRKGIRRGLSACRQNFSAAMTV